MVFVHVIETVFDHTQPARPVSELLVRPRLPIRENWRFRLVVNLIWFARNYLNFIFLVVFVSAFWFPGFLLPVLCTIYIHTAKKETKKRTLCQVAQLGSLLLNNYLYGWVSGFVFSVTLGLVVCVHAVTTPYGDEAVERYHQVIQNSKDAKVVEENMAPRTPVTSYVPKTFAEEEPVPPLPSVLEGRALPLPVRRLPSIRKGGPSQFALDEEGFPTGSLATPRGPPTTQGSFARLATPLATPKGGGVGASRSFNVLPNTRPNLAVGT